MARPIGIKLRFQPIPKGPARSPVRGDNEAEPRRQSNKIIEPGKTNSFDCIFDTWAATPQSPYPKT